MDVRQRESGARACETFHFLTKKTLRFTFFVPDIVELSAYIYLSAHLFLKDHFLLSEKL